MSFNIKKRNFLLASVVLGSGDLDRSVGLVGARLGAQQWKHVILLNWRRRFEPVIRCGIGINGHPSFTDTYKQVIDLYQNKDNDFYQELLQPRAIPSCPVVG